jgi:acyl-coenzyme A thioesterase PaaI-like protein
VSSCTHVESRNETEGDSRAQLETTCFACGRDNPFGLQVSYQIVKPGTVHAEWRPEHQYSGFGGIVHGGIVSTALDEAMAKAIVSTDAQGLTCELKVRFHHSVHPGDELRVDGWIVERKRRLIKTEACVCDVGGREVVHAWAVFLVENGTHPRHAW